MRAVARSGLLNEVQHLARRLGRSPRLREYREAYGRHAPFQRRFGTWNRALTAAGLPEVPRGALGHVRRRGNSDRLLDEIRRLGRRLGHSPRLREYRAAYGRRASFQPRFGSWSKALAAAGWPGVTRGRRPPEN
jgi:hypothetical protein